MATRLTKAQIEAKLRKHFPGAQAKLMAEVIDALATDVAALDTWGAATATKLNALGTKLNSDTGVADVNYATDYDTTPIG